MSFLCQHGKLLSRPLLAWMWREIWRLQPSCALEGCLEALYWDATGHRLKSEHNQPWHHLGYNTLDWSHTSDMRFFSYKNQEISPIPIFWLLFKPTGDWSSVTYNWKTPNIKMKIKIGKNASICRPNSFRTMYSLHLKVILHINFVPKPIIILTFLKVIKYFCGHTFSWLSNILLYTRWKEDIFGRDFIYVYIIFIYVHEIYIKMSE